MPKPSFQSCPLLGTVRRGRSRSQLLSAFLSHGLRSDAWPAVFRHYRHNDRGTDNVMILFDHEKAWPVELLVLPDSSNHLARIFSVALLTPPALEPPVPVGVLKPWWSQPIFERRITLLRCRQLGQSAWLHDRGLRSLAAPRWSLGVQKQIAGILEQEPGDAQLESACLSGQRGHQCFRQRSNFSSQ